MVKGSDNKNQCVGVLTFHFADNYGAVLQAYGTIKYLAKLGFKAKIINYRPQKLIEEYDINPFHKRGINIIKSIFLFKHKCIQVNLFQAFRAHYLNEDKDSYNEISEACKNCNVIIVGSDQVWNTDLTYGDKAYFLYDVSDDISKIGFAISIGRYNIPTLAEYINLYSSNFKALSFREEKAAEICNANSSVSARVVADPVFLLSDREWNEIEEKPKNFRYEKYILYYVLEKNESLFNTILEYSREMKLPIIAIHPTATKCKYKGVINLNNVGPREFIWMINHAEYIGTNSFHGMAFSVIFKKKIIYAAHANLGDRNRHLLSLFGKFDCRDGKCFDFETMDYKKLDLLISDSKQFLKSAIKC